MEDTLDAKYRPKNLKDVIGQNVPTRSLANAFSSNKLKNAYILHGKYGTGKTTVGRILAAMINCEKGPTLNPCGICDNCDRIFKGKDFDTIEIDAASNRGVDDIRELKKEIQQHALYGNKKVVVIDECLGKDSRINTENGLIPVSDIVNNKTKMKVLSYNEKSKKNEYKEITGWFKNSKKDIYKLIFETRGHIYASEGHLISTPDGYKRVDELKEGDVVYRRGKALTKYQEQMIYGSLLGDMSIYRNKPKGKILKNGTSSRLKCVHGEKQKDYLVFKQNILEKFVKTPLKDNSHVGFEGYGSIKTSRFSTITDRCFSSIYENVIVDGKKTINQKWMDKLDWISIAFWYMDDGSCNKYYVKTKNKYNRAVSFHTQCFSLEEHKIIQDFFLSKGIKTSIVKDKRCDSYFLNVSTEGTEKLFNNISKYIPDSMRYKLYDFDGDAFNSDLVDNKTLDSIVTERIIEKSLYTENSVTYDIEVEGNHNYYVSNTLVHNCHSLTGIASESSLKMLEEPPNDVIFILCTTDFNKVLPPIKSRCACYRFNEVSWVDIFEHLKHIAKEEKLDVEEEALKICAKSSDGSIRNSLQNLQAIIDYTGDMTITKELAKEALGEIDDNYYFKLIDAIIKTKAPEAFNIINDILKEGKDVNHVLRGFYKHFDNLFKLSKLISLPDEDLGQMGYSLEDIKKYRYQLSTFKDNPEEKIDILFTLLKKVNEGLEFNVDPNVLFDAYIVKSITLLNKKS